MRLEEHGITMGCIYNGALLFHTYRFFGLVAQEIPVFQPPAPKVQKIDVPGSSGEIDLTDSLTGEVSYGNRKGKLKFVAVHPNGFATAYARAMQYIHGKRLRVVLDDDPNYYYEGRWTVEQWEGFAGASLLVLGYDLLPYKFPVPTPLSDLWTGGYTIPFEFVVSVPNGSTISRTLINPTDSAIRPVITCSSNLRVTVNGTTYYLSAGDNTPFSLAPGSTRVTFVGGGRFSVRYYPTSARL